jgi:tRNA A-37 threonylcarbamoyl transferase component Bud32
MRRRILLAASPEWQLLSDQISGLVDDAEFERVKRTSRAQAGFIAYGGGEAFVKRIDAGGYMNGLLARAFGSRARRAWRGAQLLAHSGFGHPEPLLIMEERALGSIRACYIATRPLRDSRVLSRFALGRLKSPSLRRTVSKRVAGEIRRLHDAGIYTRDLQETNLMIEERDGELLVYFVDFEDFRRSRRVTLERRLLNLVHLDRSIGRFASRAHRLRFFYDYLGERPARADVRRLLEKYAAARVRVERRRSRDRAQTPAAINFGVLPSATKLLGDRQE